MGISLVVCKRTAEGASRAQTRSSGAQLETVGWHLVLMQPPSPKLAASMTTGLWWGGGEATRRGSGSWHR